MLTLQDCIALCALEPDEVAAIARHEHIPEMLAVELGDYLCRTPDGQLRVARMLKGDILAARRRGDLLQAARLKLALKHFVETHRRGHGA